MAEEYKKPEKIISLYPTQVSKEGIRYQGIQAIKEGNDFFINFTFETDKSNIGEFLETNKADQVVGIIPSLNVFQRVVNLPPVDPKRIPEIIRFEAVQQIPFDIKETSWNYKRLEDPENPCISILLSAVKKETIKEHFPYEKMTVIDTANHSLPSLYKDGNKKNLEGILVIDKEYTIMEVCKNRVNVWNRCIPVGTNNFKKDYEAGVSDLIEEIKRSVGFWKSINPKEKIPYFISPNKDEELLKQISAGIETPISYKNPYERFAGNFHLPDEYFYAASGILVSEDAVNLIFEEKRRKFKGMVSSLLKKISGPIATTGRKIEEFGDSVYDAGEKVIEEK